VIWPFTKLKQQKIEIERLHDVITKQLTSDITIEDLNVKGGELNLTLEGSPLHIFADVFGKQFYQSGATNFLTMDFHHIDSGEDFEVTMQKVSGESLANQLKRLRSELDELKANQ
jgi:hypothetical protein